MFGAIIKNAWTLFKENLQALAWLALPLIFYQWLQFIVARQIWAVESDQLYGEALVNHALLRFLSFCILLAFIAAQSYGVLSKILNPTDHSALWRGINSRVGLKIFALYFLFNLSAVLFYALIVPPLVHLIGVLNLSALGAQTLILTITLPLALWFGHFLTRLSLAMPAWVQGEKITLRDALEFTEDRAKLGQTRVYWIILQVEMMLIFLLFVGRIFAPKNWSNWGEAFIGAPLNALCLTFALLILASVFNALRKARPTKLESP